MLDQLLEARTEIQTIAAWLLCLAALRWGGGPERAIAIVWLALFEVLDTAYHALADPTFQVDRLDPFHAVLDLTVAVAFIVIALRANRFYPLWLAGFQIVAFSAHLARGIADAVTPIAYAFLVIAPSYFQLALLLGGLLAHRRRLTRYGPYRDWRPLSPRMLTMLSSPAGQAGTVAK